MLVGIEATGFDLTGMLDLRSVVNIQVGKNAFQISARNFVLIDVSLKFILRRSAKFL